ncbi:GT2 family glycosyltransferase [Thiogranum longum]|uniref:GT2 family glycosyltransferase n=1 Tax=Thiogranum longum TaxID=1537524 RepID=A0A4V2PH05_9GAMM|nr:sulfotransferase [Thiogranum longum]TCK18856.1 GT2 family glycosyltransferase [Thiogranum longum]
MPRFDDQGSNLIFLLSLPRSGSTLLQRILGGHSQIHTLAEPWLMLNPLYTLRKTGVSAEYDADLARQGLEDFLAELDDGSQVHLDAVRAYAARLYGAALAQSGKTIFLDKTPRYYQIIPELRACFPKAKFVFLLRNPAAVLSSTLQTWFDNDPEKLNGTSNCRDLTAGAVFLADALRDFGDNAIVVHYEDLVSDPKQTIDVLCDQLGLTFEENVLDYSHTASFNGHHGDQTRIHEHGKAVEDYRDAWVHNLQDKSRMQYTLDYLETLGPEVMDGLGYDAGEIRGALQTTQENSEWIAADKVNAEGEALFQGGDTEGALDNFRKALALCDDFVLAYNNMAVLYWHRKDAEQAVIALTEGLSRQPRDRDLVLTAGHIFTALGMKNDALGLLSAYLHDSPDDAEVLALRDEIQVLPDADDVPETGSASIQERDASGPEIVEPAAGPIAVITSIAPTRIDVQQRAIQSWLDHGFEVMSLNVQEEIDRLEADFPGVNFIRARRDGRKRLGKPYVYINDMFSALRQSGREIVGVINSDIILRAGETLNRVLHREAPGGLLYGSRIDVDHIEDEAGRYYNRGFDLFFMDRDVLRDIPDNGFMLGMPWWDYWFPCLMLQKGVTVKRIDNPGAYHWWHKPNYSTENSVAFGADFVEAFPRLPFMHMYEQSIEAGLGGFRYTVLSDCALYFVARNSETVRLPGPGGSEAVARSNPKITAIVSTYASGEFIGECLQDLVNQTIADDIEILVIDAASPQNERAVVEEFCKHHSNIRYHRTPERIGIYAAWNLAVEMASGDYLISCSTNDRLREDACEILARSLDDQPDVALVYGNSFLTKQLHRNFDNAELYSMYIWPEYRYEELLDRSMVGPHPMWRRSVHDTVGRFDESLLALGDQDFWIRLGEQHKLLALPDFTGLYLVSEDSLTGNTDVSRVEEDRVHLQWGWHYHYEKWFNRRLENLDPVRCLDGPTVQIIVRSPGTAGSAVADTLDAVAEQAYPNWKLAVIANEACPDPLFDEHPQLTWIQATAGCGLDEGVESVLAGVQENSYVVFMEAGERLDALFLSDACAALERHPGWQVLYCDDDCVSASGELGDPRFKPDFNLDMLRGADYIGNACLFRAGSVAVVGGVQVFDLLLRVFDHFGREGIGHLDEQRFHRSGEHDNCCKEAVEQRRNALQAHLERCGEQAVIEDALVPGSFMLSYISDDKPKVSLLVLANESGGGVGNAVHSILDKTVYPDFEIRVLAGPDVPSAVIDRLKEIQKENPALHLERCANKPLPSRLNQLAGDCEGEFLLWLNENILVLQEEWLSRLVAAAQRKHVGVVGARIVNRNKALLDAGVIPGIGGRGAGAGILSGQHMGSAGYMGRAQLVQESGAVSALCMLVSKELFNKAGGFDKSLAVDLYRSIDFCERIRTDGFQVIWTPHVTLMYLGAISAIDGKPESEAQVNREIDLLQERWLDRFAREPAFNRHLSLSRGDYGLESATPSAWNPVLDTLPRVLSFGVGSYGSWQYRVTQPLDALQDKGMVQRMHTALAGKDKICLPGVVDLERLQPDTLLMHNALHDDYIEAMEKYKRVNDAFIVFGQDDLMTALPPKNPFSKTVYKDMKRRVRKCLSLADRLVVTTEPLAQALKGMVDDICIIPNALDENIWGRLESQRHTGRKPRVGWAGAQQHQGDLELLETVVRELADEVEWVFFGMCPAVLRPWVREIHDAVNFEAYPGKLASLDLDLAIAPLEHNRFNESKSNLRVLEYGVLGWPVIATDIHPYQGVPVCRVPNQPRAWINAIRERIHEFDAMAREGDQLRDWVNRNAMLKLQLDAWMSALNLSTSDHSREHPRHRAASLQHAVYATK